MFQRLTQMYSNLAFRSVPTVNHHTKAMLHARQILRMTNKRSHFCESLSIVSVLFEFSSLSKEQMLRTTDCFDEIYELQHCVAQSQHGRIGWEWMTVYCWPHGGQSCVCFGAKSLCMQWALWQFIQARKYVEFLNPRAHVKLGHRISFVFFLELWMFLNFPGKGSEIVDILSIGRKQSFGQPMHTCCPARVHV